MIAYFRSLPFGHFPVDGCVLLVREAWHRLYQLDDLPTYADRFVTPDQAQGLMDGHLGQLVEPIEKPSHGCMVVASSESKWHCGVFTTEQMPGYVIHTLGQAIKIEPLNAFRRRFDTVEFYRHVTHRSVLSSDPKGPAQSSSG
ncbi:hypothetical protein [Vibrio sp. 1982]|uniref:hypothetical protein n=1 Tax=Vibrio sp. 1982 TaxID=3074586 RepID=UPI0029645FBB|nr:hypothetical protein [Vibrio sp. 1982]MDW2216201.1 hypothetical protein [Vibrio sp. 1982]